LAARDGELARLERQIERQRIALAAAETARAAAEDAAQSRVAFLAAMTHELRTPLNAILGFSEVLQHEMFGPLGNDRYREYAGIIHKSGSHLLSIVNDVLDMAKVEAGKLELYLEPVDLCRIVIDCVRSVEPMVARSRVCVRVDLHDRIGFVQADEKRLRQMLLNLLSNAIKFTHAQGEVGISVFRCGNFIAIAVSDTGIGMKNGDIEKALEPYGQLDNALVRRHEKALEPYGQLDNALVRRHTGTGLGLPLTNQLAMLHGGALRIESAPGAGTTVTIFIPGESPAHQDA
jgi:two-component system cell cycle sensor histidine kinase PleC